MTVFEVDGIWYDEEEKWVQTTPQPMFQIKDDAPWCDSDTCYICTSHIQNPPELSDKELDEWVKKGYFHRLTEPGGCMIQMGVH